MSGAKLDSVDEKFELTGPLILIPNLSVIIAILSNLWRFQLEGCGISLQQAVAKNIVIAAQ